MKNKFINIIFIIGLVAGSNIVNAQTYRTAATEALENNGKQWVEKKLPPSVITFSGYTGQVEIKTLVASLEKVQDDSLTNLLPSTTDYADFTMILDKDQLPEQIATPKTFTTTGLLTLNNTSKKISAQYTLEPHNNTGDGFIISVAIRFNPSDFNIKMKDEPTDEPMIVKVSGGYLNKQQNNF